MKHIVVGAGATFAEALALGNARDACPPLMADFAKKMWSNYSPHPVLEEFLEQIGYPDAGHDPRELFYELEGKGETNIEKFMEYAWQNRNQKFDIDPGRLPPGYISGLRLLSPGSSLTGGKTIEDGFWQNLLYHGVGGPLGFLMSQCFFESGKGWKELRLSKTLAAQLLPGDLVLNLNYDTVFELALEQLGRPIAYSPNQQTDGQILICKPHGSLNLVANETAFKFGQPSWLGMPQTPGFNSFSGLVPPRLNKNYAEHPISKAILAPVRNRRPKDFIMWGVGLTESDADLMNLYSRWLRKVKVIDVINPDPGVAAKVRALFGREVRQHADVFGWVGQRN